MGDVAFLLYRSETDMRPHSDPAQQLLATARHVNAQMELTGFLHHEEGFFFQWLEGPATALDTIAGRLERDARHANMTYLWRGTQQQRQFDGWQMGYSTRSASSILSWLADHPVAQRKRQAYASGVLAFLQGRNVAESD